MIYKNKLVESVMDDLKKIVPEVHQQILESDVNEDIIFSNINILLKLLDDRTKKQADFTVEISLKDDEFE
ncbi:MAG: hypothetical protein DRP42_00785 [Tenericutes bacterium]|nr:MAG: hypothetical protein DRP42_00785 [Mycoplasmatota bacterium]